MDKPSYQESTQSKEWYRVRNMDLYRDRLTGMTYAQLMTKYDVSATRLQYLLKKERAKHEARRTYTK